MSVQKISTDERQVEIALLEDLIEEVDGQMDRADEQARNAAGSVPMLKSSGAASAYQNIREHLTEKKVALEHQQRRSNGANINRDSAIRDENLPQCELFSGKYKVYWCPKWNASIRYGGRSTEDVVEDGRVGRTTYTTEVTFAVRELSRQNGDVVYEDGRHRIMDAKTLPAREAVALVKDECIPLERVSASAEARDPSARYHGVKKYHVVEP
ncbi:MULTISPECIES: hypothetical protein [unclassified Haloferax]|jgi:hypothetical protein|uniref:hypothetical protein n=1 Tax=unclassified Haloferax TaxID=2625095 RepID=UPI00287676FB|nr:MULTISPECIES: hypothetical protein [unclassified Haloferax]MDS0243089.1 hypothetical protein [Haloferax sp. S2CR25]MDS0446210.1 hypothetical protein [Haloferax sp. S2CR25-2]